MTANQDLFDAALRHQVALRRYSDIQRRAMLDVLEAADADLVAQLRARLGPVLDATNRNQRLNALLRDVRAKRRALMSSLEETTQSQMEALAEAEAAWEQRIMAEAVPVQFDLASIPLDRLKAAATGTPMHGKRLGEWFKHLGDSDRARVNQAVQLGVVNGETLDDIVRRLAGTRANNYSDGVLSTTRREAETIARTAVNHVSNSARSEVWDANDDIIWGLRWTATLDGRTSPVCQARDGAIAVNPGREIPPGTDLLDPQDARPPGHPNCRSVMVAMLSPDMIIGDRPFVSDSRTRAEREKDFRREARDADPDAWKAMTPTERNAEVKRIRDKWGDDNIGTVPASTTYEEWMGRQSAEFQDATLGPSRAEMFREGKVTLDQFVDAGGRSRTLNELDGLLSPTTTPASRLRDLGRSTGFEHFELLDASGKLLTSGTSQDARKVSFTSQQVALMSREGVGAILHHNHPARYTSFSPADVWAFTRLKGLDQFWAHAYEASYSFGRTAKTNSITLKVIQNAEREAQKMLARAVNSGGSIGKLLELEQHAMSLVLRNRGYLKYNYPQIEGFETEMRLLDP